MWHWSAPLWLWLLPVILLPWLSHNTEKRIVWSALVPADPVSTSLTLLIKGLGSLTLTALIIALAGPYSPEQITERQGRGAEFIIMLDRSRSMDEAFARQPLNTLPTERKPQRRKREIAGEYLFEFIDSRPDDRFAYLMFSNQATKLLPLSYNKTTVKAVVQAGRLGKGLSKTNIVDALTMAAEMYQGEPYRGSRNVLLISDGGETLTAEEEQFLTELYQDMQLNIYWIYLKSNQGMSLEPGDDEPLMWQGLPERKLHESFTRMDVPYTPLEAGTLEEFTAAVNAIDREQYAPLIVEQRLPREPHQDIFLIIALIASGLLFVSYLYTLIGVRQAYRK